jgi:hypothetical protein
MLQILQVADLTGYGTIFQGCSFSGTNNVAPEKAAGPGN